MVSIRKMEDGDVAKLADLWLQTSVIAHGFIPESHWIQNRAAMEQDYLPAAEVYVAEMADDILGFIALVDKHIAAIFVAGERQGEGIGTALMDFAKGLRRELTLKVYRKNKKSVRFYQASGFEIVGESVDDLTNESELLMGWSCVN